MGWRRWLGLSLAVYLAILLLTRPVNYVDSLNYALQMVQHTHGTIPLRLDHVWDFGHAAWRPMGLVVWSVFRGLFNGWYPGDEALSAACALVLLSIVGGAFSLVFLFLTAARVTGKAWVGGTIAMGYISTAMVMNYVLTGTAYMTGVSCQFAALYLLCIALQTGRLSGARPWGAGLFLGASICIWFPFVLGMAGFLCFAWIWPENGQAADVRGRLGFVARIVAGIAAIVIVVYAGVLAEAHITSFGALLQWMAQSRYGISPTKGYLRVIAGVPRSFLWLGDDASNWKRILMAGSSGGADLLAAAHGIWKLLLVYVVLGLLVFRLWKWERGPKLLACLLAAAVPTGLFAAFLFDPSALERYIQVYPLLFLAFAFMMAADGAAWFGRGVLLLFFACMLAANGLALARFNGNRGWENAIARLDALSSRAGMADSILVMSPQDDAYKFTKARPFDPDSHLRDQLYIVIEPGTVLPLIWKQLLANNIASAWQRNGRVFASLRLLADEPARQWNWIEGDDPRIQWAALPAFFRQLDLVEPFGGADGFAELVRSAKNEQILRDAQAR